MHDLSYYDHCPVHNFHNWRIKFYIYTFENVYVLDLSALTTTPGQNGEKICCSRFHYAGIQHTVDGHFEADLKTTDEGLTIAVSCRLPKTIRTVKISLTNLPSAQITSFREGLTAIPAEGAVYTYPSGWRGLYTPLMILEDEQERYIYARSLDNAVREKRFGLLPGPEGLTLELMHEETGSRMSNQITVPTWEIGITDSADSVYARHCTHLKDCYSWPDWNQRRDVPDWMKGISLIAAIHMEHWTGYSFHTYASVIDTAKWLSKQIDPKQVLLYLPGWDGRYYWQYGRYDPADSLGGKEGFQAMMTQLHDLGFKVMLMVGTNMVSKEMENYEQWGVPSQSVNVSGIAPFGPVDWDGSRHYLHGFNTTLSIGAPHWQQKLKQKLTDLYQEYQYDAMFLDISAAWTNEQLYDNYQGLKEFIGALHDELPDSVLIAGEGWYDGLSTLTPLMQSGHTEGVMHWHDQPYPAMYEPYCRSFGHLCLGDPGRGSTGVHELGYNEIQSVPYRKSIIPTLTLVEDTLTTAEAKVLEIVETAKRYYKEFIERND